MKRFAMHVAALMSVAWFCSSGPAMAWTIGAPTETQTLDEDYAVPALGGGPADGVAWLEVTSSAVETGERGEWVYVDNFSRWWIGSVDPPSGGWGTWPGYVKLWDDSDPAARNVLAVVQVTFTQ
ncbi:MAG: hypothetical protein KJZ87_00750 [Thermoguttaceae bacterium]|nr:hypothetical protein [Thermoguttaceae bacterium]